MPWRTFVLRGTRVLARCDASGTLVDEGGRVEIRYRPNDGKSYRAASRNLEPVPDAETFADDYCVEAAPAPSAKDEKAGAKSGTGKAKSARSQAAPGHGDAEATAALGTIVAYTDGACSGNPGPAGLGVVLLRGEQRRELSEYLGTGTNNIAELTAILRALELLAELGDQQEPVLIHTDSQYAIGILQKHWKPKANQELIADLKACLKQFSRVKLVYVPGHAGVPLNERADALARQAVGSRSSSGWRMLGDSHGAHAR